LPVILSAAKDLVSRMYQGASSSCVLPVILSAAKDLSVHGTRPLSKKFDVSPQGGYNHQDTYLHFLGERSSNLPLVSFF